MTVRFTVDLVFAGAALEPLIDRFGTFDFRIDAFLTAVGFVLDLVCAKAESAKHKLIRARTARIVAIVPLARMRRSREFKEKSMPSLLVPIGQKFGFLRPESNDMKMSRRR
jgi:hypothetical protein